MATFKEGWRVLVHLPSRAEVQQGIVGETTRRKKVSKNLPWVWVNIDEHWFLVQEKHVAPKRDEPYCVEFVEALEQASLVQRTIKEIVRDYVVTPHSGKRGYLKARFGSGWRFQGAPVNPMWESLLDEAHKRLVTQAKAARAGS